MRNSTNDVDYGDGALGRAVVSGWFHHGITAIILLNAAIIGLDTSDELTSRYGSLFEFANQLILGIFIIEALIKLGALMPDRGGTSRAVGTCSTLRSSW